MAAELELGSSCEQLRGGSRARPAAGCGPWRTAVGYARCSRSRCGSGPVANLELVSSWGEKSVALLLERTSGAAPQHATRLDKWIDGWLQASASRNNKTTRLPWVFFARAHGTAHGAWSTRCARSICCLRNGRGLYCLRLPAHQGIRDQAGDMLPLQKPFALPNA